MKEILIILTAITGIIVIHNDIKNLTKSNKISTLKLRPTRYDKTGAIQKKKYLA